MLPDDPMAGKYGQVVKDQGVDVPVHTSALSFKDNHIQSQVSAWTSTLARTYDQFRSRMRMGSSL